MDVSERPATQATCSSPTGQAAARLDAPRVDQAQVLVLAERCEAAPGPDRQLDCLVWCYEHDIEPEWQGNVLVAGIEGVIGWADPGKTQRNFSCNRSATGPASIPAYTASLDAAMTLAQKGWEYSLTDCNGYDEATLTNHSIERTAWSSGQSAALALTAAALRARSAAFPSL